MRGAGWPRPGVGGNRAMTTSELVPSFMFMTIAAALLIAVAAFA
jgi:hypothetical protein